MNDRASILVNCSRAESDLIHHLAHTERRGISSYVLKVVMGYVQFEEDIFAKHLATHRITYIAPWKRPAQVPGPRSTFLLRCSRNESERIRVAAKRRDVSISGYVLSTLRRSWKVQKGLGRMSGPDWLGPFSKRLD